MTKFTCPTCQHDKFILSMHENMVHGTAPRKTLPANIKWNTFIKNNGEYFCVATCCKCRNYWYAEYPLDNLRKVMAKEGALR